jgi:shikimate 5-dehydrogenase
MSDIDWLAVHFVVSGTPMNHLTVPEKKAALRRLNEKLNHTPSVYAPGLTTEEVARRLGITQRSVERHIAQLPAADKTVCRVCREPMWVVDGVVEPHPTRLLEECPMSNKQTLKGLAAVRPDLYRWLEAAS